MSVESCPACPGKLFPAPDRLGIHGCSACGGIWADNETSQLVAAVLDPELVDLADRAATAAARITKAPLPIAGARGCPECRALLVRVNAGSTNLDVCTMHGTWFDRGELQRVSRVLDGDRGRQIPRAPGAGEWVVGNTALNAGSSPGYAVDPSASATEVAAGVVAEVAFDAGVMVLTALLSGALGGSTSDDD